MQALLTTQTDVTVSGINGIEQDAIEQPSQFLERWCAATQVPVLHTPVLAYQPHCVMRLIHRQRALG